MEAINVSYTQNAETSDGIIRWVEHIILIAYYTFCFDFHLRKLFLIK